MNILKIIAGAILTLPLVGMVVWMVLTFTIPFLMRDGIIGGVVYIVLIVVITLVLIAITYLADCGFKLLKEGKNQ